MECPDCEGEGLIENEDGIVDECDTCDGEGEIEDEDNDEE